ncbi:hypothetical protein AFK69_15030 [Xenorhabdus sp. GDc328]|uniref:IS66 family insertion sequence element accessory protein TnpA n=2 Tax=Morganellaceae TaxID=1903414 RepID=UPI000649AC09|nr:MULTISPECIES: hypothetical protein [Xenorhabdus]KLU14624.1 hypothetical protein AAY47_15395 [Xenorhabdus griffiniae]KOP32524.1 hypothetical protein AFK69_15030 [Xenorhabdus sp. GDc328]
MLTVTAFCQQREINLATFYYWARKLRQPSERQRLHPVVLDDLHHTGSVVALCLPNWIRAELPTGLSAAQIRHWLEALQ